jgi:hypothetical protein
MKILLTMVCCLTGNTCYSQEKSTSMELLTNAKAEEVAVCERYLSRCELYAEIAYPMHWGADSLIVKTCPDKNVLTIINRHEFRLTPATENEVNILNGFSFTYSEVKQASTGECEGASELNTKIVRMRLKNKKWLFFCRNSKSYFYESFAERFDYFFFHKRAKKVVSD